MLEAFPSRFAWLFYQLDRSSNLPASWTVILDCDPIADLATVHVSGVKPSCNATNFTVTDTNAAGLPRAFFQLRSTVAP